MDVTGSGKEGQGTGDVPSRVVFRVSREDEEGGTITEEREVECSPDELVELLGRPWETVEAPRPDENGAAGEAARTAVRQIADALRFVVRERPEEDGGRSYIVSFEPGTDEEAPREVTRAKVPADAAEPTELEHTARVAIQGEEKGGAELASGRNVLSVRNQAISITSLGNLYGILELHLHVHVHPPGEGLESRDPDRS